MASPQIEEGYLKIANEIAEALMRISLSAYETRVLWLIFRKTYGYNKPQDKISLTQFEKFLKMDRRHIQRTLRRLEARNMIIIFRAVLGVPKQERSYMITYQFQKDYTKWIGVPKGVQYVPLQERSSESPKPDTWIGTSLTPESVPPLTPESALVLTPESVPTKDNKDNKDKDTLKDRGAPASFPTQNSKPKKRVPLPAPREDQGLNLPQNEIQKRKKKMIEDLERHENAKKGNSP